MELIGSFYLWLSVLTLFILISLLFLKIYVSHLKLILTLAFATLSYTYSIIYWYLPQPQGATTELEFTTMTYNVNRQSWDTEAVTEILRTYSADIFGLVEPFQEQAADLRDHVQDLYPHYYRSTGGGLSLFSRYPILTPKTDSLGTSDSSLLAMFDLKGKQIRVVVTHPIVPISRENHRRRNALISALAKYAAQQQEPLIIMGDFNTVSWSPYLREFEHLSGLRNATLGYGLHPTWCYGDPGNFFRPLEQFLRLLKIPIDHIFVSDHIIVDQVTTGPAGISDHRPLITHLQLLRTR
ncbi:MAG: endonuclease/exonuclease/phosphatase family protein [Synechococcaceae cyanobacterium SM2_3_1]|nr:endonuclease/exonuclease/phosphatase family protein [Synechococcaceae cyanobacterium SM2_3_1]